MQSHLLPRGQADLSGVHPTTPPAVLTQHVAGVTPERDPPARATALPGGRLSLTMDILNCPPARGSTDNLTPHLQSTAHSYSRLEDDISLHVSWSNQEASCSDAKVSPEM